MFTKVVGFHSENELGVVQFGTSEQDTCAYISCHRAITGNLIEVRELHDSGSVSAILVLNPSDRYVFLMDGDILAGAKQNRVVNASMLLIRLAAALPAPEITVTRAHSISARRRNPKYPPVPAGTGLRNVSIAP